MAKATRADGFKPLRFMKDQNVVLGLITPTFPELEDTGVVKTGIAEAAKHIPLDRLCLSPQCSL